MNRLISIVVPVYNKAPYLAECFDSLLAQTYPEVEIVAVDDGSTDASVAICEEYRKQHEKFLFLRQENAGQNAARKTGVDAANGDWIVFVDADDYLSLNACEILMKNMNQTQSDFVVGVSRFVYPGNRLGPVSQISAGIYSGIERLQNGYVKKDSLVLLPSRPSGSLCSILYRKKQIQDALQILDMGIRYGEDNACLWFLMARAERISYIPDVVYLCRQVQDSVSRIHVRGGMLPKLSKYAHDIDRVFQKAGLSPEKYSVIDAMTFHGVMMQAYEFLDDFPGIFPYFEGSLPKQIKIYGAGDFGKEFYAKEKERLNIVGWYDRNFESYREQGLNVQSPEHLVATENECILITAWRESTAREIARELAERIPHGTKVYTMNRKLFDSDYVRRKLKELRGFGN